MGIDLNSVEISEFSVYELLYMGHEELTFYVENMIAAHYAVDPFEIIAALEEAFGKPLANFKETPM